MMNKVIVEDCGDGRCRVDAVGESEGQLGRLVCIESLSLRSISRHEEQAVLGDVETEIGIA